MSKPGPIARAGGFVRDVCDRFWLFSIAAISLVVIGVIVSVVGFSDRELTAERTALLTSVATGLLMIVQKVIEAQQQRRMADQLARSRPHDDQASGKEDDPVHTVEEDAK